MKVKKIPLLLSIIIATALIFSSCALFGGGDPVRADGLPALDKRIYWSPGGEFVTNVKDNPKMLVRTVVSLMFSKDESADLETNSAAIRNIILQILMEKTEEELEADNIITTLEAEMTEGISNFLNMDEFLRVYISDFVMQ